MRYLTLPSLCWSILTNRKTSAVGRVGQRWPALFLSDREHTTSRNIDPLHSRTTLIFPQGGFRIPLVVNILDDLPISRTSPKYESCTWIIMNEIPSWKTICDHDSHGFLTSRDKGSNNSVQFIINYPVYQYSMINLQITSGRKKMGTLLRFFVYFSSVFQNTMNLLVNQTDNNNKTN